jgi:hypothetical protein
MPRCRRPPMLQRGAVLPVAAHTSVIGVAGHVSKSIWIESSVSVLAPIWKVRCSSAPRMFLPLNWCRPARAWLPSASSPNSLFSESLSLSLLVPLRGLHRQFTHALQRVAHLAQRAFGRLRHRDAVVGVAHGHVHAAHLGVHALGDRQAGGVVLGAVDAQARGQALHRRGSDICDVLRLRCAFSDTRLVLMVWGILSTPQESETPGVRACRPSFPVHVLPGMGARRVEFFGSSPADDPAMCAGNPGQIGAAGPAGRVAGEAPEVALSRPRRPVARSGAAL